jgi:CDP-diacylglycerol--glycerol-3-phosphate 3-phosphatidyltransferase
MASSGTGRRTDPERETSRVNLYATKASLNARLVPLVDRLAAAGVTPDAVTLAALPVAVLAGACLLASPALPILLLAVPALAALRLVLNLLDGNLARRTGRIHPRGELYNEVGDRLADVAFLAPVAFLPGASVPVVLLGVLAGVLASYVGITARAAGAARIYRGILSKPGRMVLLGACAVAAFVAGPPAWTAFGPLLLVGTSLTLVERLAVAVRRLP